MKNIIIIGGGIAGLSAGIYAQQSGMQATIYEMHSIPGGHSTSWKRNGYLFEGGMHWLTGSSEKTQLNKIWKETGALDSSNPIYIKDPFWTFIDGDKHIKLYRDPDKLKNQLLEISPNDEKAIKQFIKDVKSSMGMSMPVMDIKGLKTKQKTKMPLSLIFSAIKAMPTMKRLSAITLEEYANQFQNKNIRTLIKSIVGSSDFSALSSIFTLGCLATGDGGYPKGGSIKMAQNMANKFQSLGGEIKYNTKIQKVVVENNKATGVIINNELIKGEDVIITADARSAIDNLFDQPLNETWMQDMRNEVKPLMCTFIGLGVKTDLSNLPEGMMFALDEPFDFMGNKLNYISFNNYSNYKGYSPDGCTSLTCILTCDTYSKWKEAKDDGTYQEKKNKLAQRIIEKLNEFIPETKDKIEVIDVATPLTYERYTGSYQGSWMSVMPPNMKQQSFPIEQKNIHNLYFAGQRMLLSGGLPSAVTTGRQAIQHICKKDDIVFQNNI